MSVPRGRSPFRQIGPPQGSNQDEGETSLLSTRQFEAFGRTLNATANHLIGGDASQHYHNALGEIHRELRKPMIQKSVFALAKTNPRQLVRSTFSTTEIQHRALAHVPDELLHNIPQTNNSYSLFQGFEATRPEDEFNKKKRHARHGSRGQKLLEDGKDGKDSPRGRNAPLSRLKHKKSGLDHRLEMMEVRKNMCASEIVEIDKKMASLSTMRKKVLERLAGLEQEETDLELEIAEVILKMDDMLEAVSNIESQEKNTPPASVIGPQDGVDDPRDDNFMSESIYEKLTSPKSKKRRTPRRNTMPILHEHLQPGTCIKEFQAHSDTITALDFDVPFGTMVSASLDDTLRVWNLNTGRCSGLLEGHLSSVRCIQVEDNIVASGSNDATVRLWDLSQAEYTPTQSTTITRSVSQSTDPESAGDEGEQDLFPDAPTDHPGPRHHPASMADCPMFTLSSHVAEVTALHFQQQTLVSGSNDKTLRQWDLETGRCVQTLDVLWAAAQVNSATSSYPSPSPSLEQSEWFRPTVTRTLPGAVEPDFVGALQVFQSAVACGTADSVVRLWDLRSGGVQRQLIGHTGGVTALQFDDVHLVTGSLDRSIRIWDLRTGSIYDAFAYEGAISSMQFDLRRICAAAGEAVVKVYDKADGNQWDCGAGAAPQGEGAEASIVERVRIRDGYMVEGRRDGRIGVWAC